MKFRIPFWSVLVLAALFFLFAAMAGCAHTSPRPVEYRETKVVVAQRCSPNLGPEPDYPDTDAKLKVATDDFDWVKRLVAGRIMRIARDAQKTAALATCAAGAPTAGS